MYERPKLERFGTFRELTEATLGLTGGDDFGMFCGETPVGPPGRYS